VKSRRIGPAHQPQFAVSLRLFNEWKHWDHLVIRAAAQATVKIIIHMGKKDCHVLTTVFSANMLASLMLVTIPAIKVQATLAQRL
jgi:hypothetical protein